MFTHTLNTCIQNERGFFYLSSFFTYITISNSKNLKSIAADEIEYNNAAKI